MYFEGVQDIQKKMANPAMTDARKKVLEGELRNLDPLGQIQGFLNGTASRPVIMDELETGWVFCNGHYTVDFSYIYYIIML